MDLDLKLPPAGGAPPDAVPAAEAPPFEPAPRAPRTLFRRRLALPNLGLVHSERKLLLGIVDVAILFAAFTGALLLGTTYFDPPGAMLALWRWFATLAIVWWIAAQLTDAYDLALAGSAPHSMLAAGGSAAATVLIYQLVPFVTPPPGARSVPVLFALLAVTGIALWRGIYAVALVQPSFERRLLVFGAGAAGAALGQAVSQVAGQTTDRPGAANPYRGTGYRIVGYVDDDPTKAGSALPGGIPVLGTATDLGRLARELLADEVVLAITQRDAIGQPAFDALITCREQGFQVTTMQAVYERVLGRIPVLHVGRNLSAVLPVDEGGPLERIYCGEKRLLDLLMSVLALVPLGVVIPFVALANALSSPGPLFYRQTRVGQGGRPFKVLKFRTMRPDAEADTGAIWARSGDDRVTPAGRFLRRSRLDELPQVLNVLGGSMSLIGPRPERPEFVDFLACEIPFYRARHAVRPGLTGWAQVRYGYGASVDDARAKLEYDLYYVRHAGLYLDALILLKTAAVVLKLQGK